MVFCFVYFIVQIRAALAEENQLYAVALPSILSHTELSTDTAQKAAVSSCREICNMRRPVAHGTSGFVVVVVVFLTRRTTTLKRERVENVTAESGNGIRNRTTLYLPAMPPSAISCKQLWIASKSFDS